MYIFIMIVLLVAYGYYENRRLNGVIDTTLGLLPAPLDRYEVDLSYILFFHNHHAVLQYEPRLYKEIVEMVGELLQVQEAALIYPTGTLIHRARDIAEDLDDLMSSYFLQGGSQTFNERAQGALNDLRALTGRSLGIIESGEQ